MTDQLRDGLVRSQPPGGRGRLARALAAGALLVLLSGGLGVSCAEDDFPTEREGPGGPMVPTSLIDAGGDAEESLCPAELPKLGSSCPAGSMENLSRCTFVVGVCQSQNSTYDVTVDYCCAQGRLWDLCGTNTTPCDREPDASVTSTSDPDGGA
jgi:hypothetical protein